MRPKLLQLPPAGPPLLARPHHRAVPNRVHLEKPGSRTENSLEILQQVQSRSLTSALPVVPKPNLMHLTKKMPKNDKACWTVSWIKDFTHLRLLLATTAPGALFCDFGRPKLMDDTMLERNGVQLTTRARQLKCRSVKKEIWTFPLCDLHESRCNFEPPKKTDMEKGTKNLHFCTSSYISTSFAL